MVCLMNRQTVARCHRQRSCCAKCSLRCRRCKAKRRSRSIINLGGIGTSRTSNLRRIKVTIVTTLLLSWKDAGESESTSLIRAPVQARTSANRQRSTSGVSGAPRKAISLFAIDVFALTTSAIQPLVPFQPAPAGACNTIRQTTVRNGWRVRLSAARQTTADARSQPELLTWQNIGPKVNLLTCYELVNAGVR